MSDTVQTIKDRLGIAEVVGSYLKLEKAGQNYKARCPFHQEKTASFFVSPTRNSFYCFGCNRGGDIFTFVEEIEGLDFVGALKVLAERAGVTLDRYDGPKRDPERETILQILEAARRFYEARLAEAAPPREYLARRGLAPETIKAWGLGWAPAGWRHLAEELRRQGFSDALVAKAGLGLESKNPAAPGRSYDRFRSRIMFPLFDASGRVVGFSGRIFPPEAEQEPGQGGKYINTPETPVYEKGKLLHGFDRAKMAIRRADTAVLVEGQFDLILSHQAGVENAVAVSGTALTREHLTLLGRLARRVVMAFDGDAAGLAAASRGISLGLESGLDVRVARLPRGVDPADLILTDSADWRARVENAVHVLDFLLATIAERNLPARERAHAAKREVYPYLVKLRERIDQAHFIAKVAALVELDETVIRADLNDLPVAPAGSPAPAQSPVGKSRLQLIDERLAGLRSLSLVDEESPEIAELLAERAREEARAERQALTRALTQAERAGDLSKVQELAQQIQLISQKINHG